jgi:hypothetical protein
MNNYKILSNAYDDNTKQIIEGFDQPFKVYNATGCKASTYCPNSKEKQKASDRSCEAGYYCQTPFMKKRCPGGFYCPPDSQHPIPCPYETPLSRRLASSIEDCVSKY